jgi:Uma2 family endonuclease
MSSAAVQFPPDPWPEPLFHLTVRQYHAMIEKGVLTDNDPVELLEGILVFKMPKNPPHRIALTKLARALTPLLPPTVSLQTQEPITLGDGEPEPDASIFLGQTEDYPDRHPGPGEVQWVIEVADTTLARDRGVKLRSYARAGLPVYWIIDLAGQAVEVYTDAKPTLSDYGKREVYDRLSSVPVTLQAEILGSIPVADLLPQPARVQGEIEG